MKDHTTSEKEGPNERVDLRSRISAFMFNISRSVNMRFHSARALNNTPSSRKRDKDYTRRKC